MITRLNGTLWPTLEASVPAVELACNGWGSPASLMSVHTREIPGIWLCNGMTGTCPAVAQRVFLSGAPVSVVMQDGRPVGTRYEDEFAEYILLMGVYPSDKTASRTEQTTSAFENIESALKSAGFDFHNVVRTWLYMDRILEWYDDFNRARDAFFESRGIFGGFVPASTGIGTANIEGAAIVTGAIAMRPKIGHHGSASRAMVESPLQCPALDYSSTFSRAAEIVTPMARTIFVSGTASIEPEGATAYVGDIKRQIALTMDVIAAILKTRDMTLRDTVRAIAYIKHHEDRPVWQAWLKEHGLPAEFAQEVIADVCRDDLLFEVELDAVKKV
ncbi:MAG: RidA family protein [Kiritimatiellia bacterium]